MASVWAKSLFNLPILAVFFLLVLCLPPGGGQKKKEVTLKPFFVIVFSFLTGIVPLLKSMSVRVESAGVCRGDDVRSEHPGSVPACLFRGATRVKGS